MSAKLADYLQVWGLEGNNIIFSDGSFGMGFLLKPVDSSCWSVEQANDYSEKLTQFLNGLPSEIDFQFVQDIKAGNAKLIEKHKASDCSDSEVVRELTLARVQKFAKLDDEGLLPKHDLMIFIRRKPSGSLLKKASLFSKGKNFESIADQKMRQELNQSERLSHDVEAGLTMLGLAPQRLASEEILEHIYNQWNPCRNIGLGEVDPDHLRASLLFTDVGIDNTGFSMSDYNYRIISLKLLPDQTYAAMANKLRELSFDTRLFLTVHIPNQQRGLSRINAIFLQLSLGGLGPLGLFLA